MSTYIERIKMDVKFVNPDTQKLYNGIESDANLAEFIDESADAIAFDACTFDSAVAELADLIKSFVKTYRKGKFNYPNTDYIEYSIWYISPIWKYAQEYRLNEDNME